MSYTLAYLGVMTNTNNQLVYRCLELWRDVHFAQHDWSMPSFSARAQKNRPPSEAYHSLSVWKYWREKQQQREMYWSVNESHRSQKSVCGPFVLFLSHQQKKECTLRLLSDTEWDGTTERTAALQIDSKLINHSSFQLLSGLGFYLMEKKGEQVGWILLRLKWLIKWDWWREKEGEETRGRSEAKPLRRISQVGPAKLSEGR